MLGNKLLNPVYTDLTVSPKLAMEPRPVPPDMSPQIPF